MQLFTKYTVHVPQPKFCSLILPVRIRVNLKDSYRGEGEFIIYIWKVPNYTHKSKKEKSKPKIGVVVKFTQHTWLGELKM